MTERLHRFFWLVVFVCLNFEVEAQTDTIPKAEHTIYLIGDAGNGNTLVLDGLKQRLSKENKHSSVIFLGNNVLPDGMPKSKKKTNRDEAEKVLKLQLDVVEKFKGRTYFIPGNKDWNNGEADGRSAIKRQEDFIEKNRKKIDDIDFYPDNGCGDPKVVEVNKHLVMIFLDSQWWLQDWTREEEMNRGCEITTKTQWLEKIRDLVVDYRHEQIVIVMHHPPFSNGNYGGKYSWKQHLFPLTDVHRNLYVPLPGLGSLYPLFRQRFGSRQHTDHPLYRQMTEGILEALGTSKDIIFVSAHEHGLQYINTLGQHFVVSGSGGSSILQFFNADNQELYSEEIVGSKLDFKDVDYDYPSVLPDSFAAAGFAGYDASKFAKVFIGKEYRDTWSTPIKVPVLDIMNYAGGLKPTKKGGGMASNSLRLEDASGKQYAMRSINKDLGSVLPTDLQDLKAAVILRDQAAANYTYGGLPVKYLSDQLGLYHTNPKLFYVPKQSGLGSFNEAFGDELYWLEERPSDDGSNDPHFGNSEKIIGYNDLIAKLEKKQDHVVDQKSVLRARLFDLWIHDWDRHDDQWRWASFKEDDKTVYRPIPRDRDQAFYKMNGFVPWIVYTFFERKFIPFKKRMYAIKGQPFNARHFDRYFLTELTADDWKDAVAKLEADITDGMIDTALLQIPKEVREFNREEFTEKLRARRTNLASYSNKLYRYISKRVSIMGTNDDDEFQITVNDDRTVTVQRFWTDKKNEKHEAFNRTFLAKDLHLRTGGKRPLFYSWTKKITH